MYEIRILYICLNEVRSTLCKYTIRFDYIELNEHDRYFPANEVEAIKTALSSMERFAAAELGENLPLLVQINDELEQRSLGYYTELQLSPRQTNRILQKMYHRSFRQKLMDIRIEESKARLKNTKDSIMLIAEQLGFHSYPLFQAMFKQKTGLTPQAYRKSSVSQYEKTKA